MKRTPLKRKTPLRPVSPKRAKAVQGPCSTRGCTATEARIRVSETERYCRKHGSAKADGACREFIWGRDPVCLACGDRDRGVQWCHVHTRGMRYIRWDADNACGLCSSCHYAYTRSPARWVRWVERRWPGRYEALLRRELYAEDRGGHVDVAEVIRSYRAHRPWFAEDPPDGWRPSPGEQA